MGGRGQPSTQEGKRGGSGRAVPRARLPLAQLHAGCIRTDPGSIPAGATRSVPALTKTTLKKTGRVEGRSRGQTEKYEVYPRSHGLGELNPQTPPPRTPGGRARSLARHRGWGTTTAAPPVYQGEIQQREAGVGQAQAGDKGQFLMVGLSADNPPGLGALHREQTHPCPPPGNPAALWLSHAGST